LSVKSSGGELLHQRRQITPVDLQRYFSSLRHQRPISNTSCIRCR